MGSVTHRLLQADRQVNHRHVGGGNAEGHAGQLAVGGGHSEMGLLIDLANASVGHCINGPVQLGDDLADSLGSARRGGDDVLAGATAVSPQLA